MPLERKERMVLYEDVSLSTSRSTPCTLMLPSLHDSTHASKAPSPQPMLTRDESPRLRIISTSKAACSLVGHALPYSLLAFAGPPRPSPTRAPSVHLCASPLAEGTWEVTKSEPTGPLQLTTSSMRVMVAGKELCFESGAMARQASGAVTCKVDDTHVFAAACFEQKDKIEPIDYF